MHHYSIRSCCFQDKLENCRTEPTPVEADTTLYYTQSGVQLGFERQPRLLSLQ